MGIAKKLWEARSGKTSVELSDVERPSDAAAAYRIQAEVTRVAGAKVLGWKIGATAQAAMDLLGVDQPFFGPMYDRYFHHHGDTIPVVPVHGCAIETEFAVGLGADLPTRDVPYTRDEVEAAVAWVTPALEIVGARLSSGLAGASFSIIADGGANMAFAHGDPFHNWRDLDLTSHPASLFINGEEVANGHSGMLLFGDTIGAVEWLANRPELGPDGLRSGQIITTGTCTGVIPIKPGDQARADFGSMGEIAVTFSE